MFGKESELAYWSKLNDVAHDITEILTTLKDLAKTETTPSSNGQKNSKTKVYLAETSRDLLEYRESIKRELQEHGYTIYPDRSLPLLIEELEPQLTEMINQCDLSVHLIGSNYGIVPEGTNKSIVVLQNDMALKTSTQKQLKRLIWFPPDLSTEDNRQIQFISELNNSKEVQKNADLLESPIEEFKFTLHNYLSDIENERTKSNSKDEGLKEQFENSAPPLVYLVCDQRDLDNIGELEDMLFNEGYDVIVPIFDGEESQIRLDHHENLKTCDAALIYYGEVMSCG